MAAMNTVRVNKKAPNAPGTVTCGFTGAIWSMWTQPLESFP